MQCEYTTRAYQWLYDPLMGVGRSRRVSDGALTLLETGSDCQQVNRDLRRLEQKTSSPRYPKSAPYGQYGG